MTRLILALCQQYFSAPHQKFLLSSLNLCSAPQQADEAHLLHQNSASLSGFDADRI